MIFVQFRLKERRALRYDLLHPSAHSLDPSRSQTPLCPLEAIAGLVGSSAVSRILNPLLQFLREVAPILVNDLVSFTFVNGQFLVLGASRVPSFFIASSPYDEIVYRCIEKPKTKNNGHGWNNAYDNLVWMSFHVTGDEVGKLESFGERRYFGR